ncbi:MAG: type I-F CRISPR-associated endoribonuclease Cas6/Csy4 [Candidatus Competibacter sp.]
MDAYLEIRLLPDPEFAPTTLMNVLFSKLHHALTALGGGKIGVSFPDVEPKKPALGQRLRLHGSQADLAALMASSLLVGMRDHTAVTAIAEVPAHAKARVVRRVHEKSSLDRQRRRIAKRKGVSAERAREMLPDSVVIKPLKLPYVTVSSQSTDQKFRLFIEHLAIQDQAAPGKFSAYGLSPTATIPWF